ncbi:retrovirus-related pol polyprotein from transposon TNT 1-94 [Tanacetum coccineum]
MKEVIQFLKSLKELFNDFDKGRNLEINEVKTVFKQMEVVVDQSYYLSRFMNVVMHAVVLPENDNFLTHDNFLNELLKGENDHLIELLISQDIIHTAVNSLAAINDYKCMEKSFVDEYNETLELKTELAKKNEMVDKPLPPRIKNNRESHLDYLKVTQEHTDILWDIVEQARALKPLDNSLDYACKYTQRIQELLIFVCASCPSSKHVSDRLVVVTLLNKTRKVRFGNDQIAKIMGYGDYQLGNVTISRVYYVEGLRHNLFSVGQFYDSDLEVVFRKRTCFVRKLEGKSKKSSLKPKAEDNNQEKLYLLHMDLCGPMCVESINRKNKDLGKLKLKDDIGIFVGYAPAKKAYRIYNRRTRMIMETIHVTFDELIAMASEQLSLGPTPQLLTPGITSSGLGPNHDANRPGKDMCGSYRVMWRGYGMNKIAICRLPEPVNFSYARNVVHRDIGKVNEYFNPPPRSVSLVQAAAAPRPVNLDSLPSSTTIDKDAPSASISSTQEQEQSPIIS